MKKLLAILIVLTLLLCPLPTLAEDAPEGLLGGWRLVKLKLTVTVTGLTCRLRCTCTRSGAPT